MKTYNAKVKNLDHLDYSVLSSFGELFATVKHHLFKDLYKNKRPVNELKKSYQKRFGINARHFNSIADRLKGQVKNEKENQKYLTTLYKRKIDSLTKKIKNIDKKVRHSNTGKIDKKRSRFILHQKKRKLFNLESKLKKCQERLASEIPKVCFGGKKLFKSQHNLAENQFTNHQEWKEQFKLQREGEIYFLGSSDRTLGNGNCHFVHIDQHNQCSLQESGNALKITLPNAVIEKHQLNKKHLFLNNVSFPDDKTVKKSQKGEATFGEIIENYLRPKDGVKVKGPITYRLKLLPNAEVKIAASIREEDSKIVTNSNVGAIGIDLNYGFIAAGTIDRFGNPISAYHLGMGVKGKNRRQASEIIRLVAQKVVDQALEQKIPIAIESLNFDKKKSNNLGTKMNALLSSFPYRKFREHLKTISHKKGVKLLEVNPAFTSVIGFAKFCRGYGLSSHQGAAVAIARRGLNFGEKVSTRSAPNVPAEFLADLEQANSRDTSGHVWKKWSFVAKGLNIHKKMLLGIHSSFEKT